MYLYLALNRVAGVRKTEAEVLQMAGTCLDQDTGRAETGISYKAPQVGWSISPSEGLPASLVSPGFG